MTTAADTASEQAFEAALAGRPVLPWADGLAVFTKAARATAIEPGRPNAALAELLAHGLTVDRPAPSLRGARHRARGRGAVRGLGWFSPAHALASAAAGAGILLAGLSGAGSAGILPAAAQHAFARAVQAATPFHAPDPARTPGPGPAAGAASPGATAGTTSGPPAGSRSAAPLASADVAPAGYDCDPATSFDVCVRRHGHDGTLTPGQLAAWAHYYQAHHDSAQRADRQQPNQPDTTDSGGGAGKGAGAVSPGQQSGNGHGDSASDPRPDAAPGQGHR